MRNSYVEEMTGSGLGCAGFCGTTFVYWIGTTIPIVALAWLVWALTYLRNPPAGGRLGNGSHHVISIGRALGLPKDSAIAMITAYFDESGTHDAAVATTVGGFFANQESWDKFNSDWLSILGRWNVSCLHMKDFAHFRGEYTQFKQNERSRRDFLGNLLACIMAYCPYGCAVSVLKEDHRNLAADARLGGAYTLASKRCLVFADKWIKDKAPRLTPPILMVMESGCEYSRELIRHLDELERPMGWLNDFGPVSFGTRLQFPGLQAADLLVYEQGKFVTEYLKVNHQKKPRVPYELLSCIPHDWHIMGAHEIAEAQMGMLLNDMLIGDIEAIRKYHPHLKITIDGEVFDISTLPSKEDKR